MTQFQKKDSEIKSLQQIDLSTRNIKLNDRKAKKDIIQIQKQIKKDELFKIKFSH